MGVACLERKDACRILVGILEGTRQLGRPRRRWEDNINMDFQEMGWRDMDWIAPTQDRDSWRPLVNALIQFNVIHCPCNYVIYLQFNTNLSHCSFIG
jgi:hypothetical protein